MFPERRLKHLVMFERLGVTHRVSPGDAVRFELDSLVTAGACGIK